MQLDEGALTLIAIFLFFVSIIIYLLIDPERKKRK